MVRQGQVWQGVPLPGADQAVPDFTRGVARFGVVRLGWVWRGRGSCFPGRTTNSKDVNWAWLGVAGHSRVWRAGGLRLLWTDHTALRRSVGHGRPRQGSAGLGLARLGSGLRLPGAGRINLRKAWRGVAWSGEVGPGSVGHGWAWYGSVWRGEARSGEGLRSSGGGPSTPQASSVAWHGEARSGTARHGTVWRGAVRRGSVGRGDPSPVDGPDSFRDFMARLGEVRQGGVGRGVVRQGEGIRLQGRTTNSKASSAAG